MGKERNTEITEAYGRIIKPWTSLGLEPPVITVKELAREAGLKNPSTLVDQLTKDVIVLGNNDGMNNRLLLEDINGQEVTDINRAAKKAAPYKRAVRVAEYRSRNPGGGPVVKRRVNEKSLMQKLRELGKGRLRIGVTGYDLGEERRNKREATKERLALRWLIKPPAESDPTIIQTEKTLSLIKKLSEKRGVTDENEIFQRLKVNIESGQPQVIVAIWGPPYEGQGLQDIFNYKSPEEKTARSIEDIIKQLGAITPIRLMVLYADYYGTDINGIPKEEVDNYGRQISRRFENIGELICWSKLKEENDPIYGYLWNDLSGSVVIPDAEEVRRALIMQRKLGNTVSDALAREAAIMYRRERIIEGKLLARDFIWRDTQYSNIIKLGTASTRLNDDPYEAQLPRFYVSGMPRSPWNTPR